MNSNWRNNAQNILVCRHSKKGSGEFKDLLSAEGAALAFLQGMNFRHITVGVVFHTPLVRTRQTAHCFLAGTTQTTDVNWREVTGLGSNEEFEIACPEPVINAYLNNIPIIQAMEEHFSTEEMKSFRREAAEVLWSISIRCSSQATILVVGHDPFVSLAVCEITGKDLEICKNLPEMTLFHLEIFDKGGENKVRLINTYPQPTLSL